MISAQTLPCIEHVTVTLAWCMYIAACDNKPEISLHTLASPVHVQVSLFIVRAAVSNMRLLACPKRSAASMPILPCHIAHNSCMYRLTPICSLARHMCQP